jgi:hypothetical protein
VRRQFRAAESGTKSLAFLPLSLVIGNEAMPAARKQGDQVTGNIGANGRTSFPKPRAEVRFLPGALLKTPGQRAFNARLNGCSE